MHLQKTFPEIHAFFLQNHFDQEQLENLKLSIKSTYLDKELLRNAEALLKLELMKFQILEAHPEQKEKVKKLVLSKIEKPNYKKTDHSSQKSKNKLKPLVTVTFETSFPKQIDNLSVKLKMTKSELVELCLKKEINIRKIKSLNDSQLEKLVPLFQSRIGEIRAKERKEADKNKSRPNDSKNDLNGKNKNRSSWTGDVYDKIGTYGLGKIIYIRSK